MNLDKMIIEHCAPTLAKIKTANLINVKYSCVDTLMYHFNLISKKIKSKGISMKILRLNTSSALIYIFRDDFLNKDINNKIAKEILFDCGYETIDTTLCLDTLISRLNQSNEFPHEIGLFLGYPPEDVKGFIFNKGKNCRYCGYWKVYTNVKTALNEFKKFDLCRLNYIERFNTNKNIANLIVA